MKFTRKKSKTPKVIKGTGFYVPMDIAPGEFGSTVDYPAIKKVLLHALEADWGPRCLIKDTDDLDDLITVGDSEAGRCPVCLVYEKFDKFWKAFAVEDVS